MEIDNRDYYTNNKIVTKAAFYKNLSYRFVNIYKNNVYTFNSSSASIINDTNNPEEYILFVRAVNYKIDQNGYSTNLNNQTVSVNRIIFLDRYFTEKKHIDLEINFTDVPYVGLEDVRIFNFNNRVFYIGSYFNREKNAIQIASNYMDVNSRGLRPVGISPSFQTNYIWEKNWVFFKYKDDINIIYKWKPIYICKINFQTQKLDLIETKENVPEFFNRFKGSTNGVEYDNKILFITHIHRPKNERRQYVHNFVLFDKNMNLLGFSDPFNFEMKLIEFCTGMTYNDRKGNFIITYSTFDRTTKLLVLTKSYIEGIIHFI
jgi:hypothetical protein